MPQYALGMPLQKVCSVCQDVQNKITERAFLEKLEKDAIFQKNETDDWKKQIKMQCNLQKKQNSCTLLKTSHKKISVASD